MFCESSPEGGLLSALEEGKACLIFLGDLIHSQESGELEDMSSSVLILDLFAMLKRRFPRKCFLHSRQSREFFSECRQRGRAARPTFTQTPEGTARQGPLSPRLKTCSTVWPSLSREAGLLLAMRRPVRSTVNRFTLVNIQRYPGIQAELVWNRLRQTNRPAGYGKGSVKRFRIALDLPKHAPLIVAHTPLSTEETVWLNVGDIKGHHVVYSAHTHRAAAMTISGGTMTPLEFIPEPALESVNSEHDAKLALAQSG